jgi:aminoglycoside 2''-phosphotransferase
VPTNNRPTFLSDLDLDRIKQGLEQTFPRLMPDLSEIELLNDGFSSYVILVAEEFILRIAKHAEAMAGHINELAVLPLLQRYLPIQVPQPIWRLEPSGYFPFGAIGYRRISGIPFSLSLTPHVKLQGIVQDLAQFLVALHNVPLVEMTAPKLMAADEFKKLWAEVIPTLDTYFREDDSKKIKIWWERFLNNQAKIGFTPKLIHGDPWGENIILNETLNNVVGVVDFEMLSIGDVAQDFAAQKYLGPDFLHQVIERYKELGGELESDFAVRLRDWSMLRELRGLHYAVRYPGSGELLDSIGKVRHELSLFDHR